MSSRSRASIKSLSASSIISLKKADVAAELAVKEAEFNALQERVQHKEETVRMEEETRMQESGVGTDESGKANEDGKSEADGISRS